MTLKKRTTVPKTFQRGKHAKPVEIEYSKPLETEKNHNLVTPLLKHSIVGIYKKMKTKLMKPQGLTKTQKKKHLEIQRQVLMKIKMNLPIKKGGNFFYF